MKRRDVEKVLRQMAADGDVTLMGWVGKEEGWKRSLYYIRGNPRSIETLFTRMEDAYSDSRPDEAIVATPTPSTQALLVEAGIEKTETYYPILRPRETRTEPEVGGWGIYLDTCPDVWKLLKELSDRTGVEMARLGGMAFVHGLGSLMEGYRQQQEEECNQL